MKFHDFLESIFVSTNISNQQSYHPAKQAKTMAVQSLINAQRTVLKWLNYPVLLFNYILVALRFVAPPMPANEVIKAFNDSQKNQPAAVTPPETPSEVQS